MCMSVHSTITYSRLSVFQLMMFTMTHDFLDIHLLTVGYRVAVFNNVDANEMSNITAAI